MNYQKPRQDTVMFFQNLQEDHRLILTTKAGNTIYVSSNKPFEIEQIKQCISSSIILEFPTSTTNTLIVNFEEVIVAEIQNLPEKDT